MIRLHYSLACIALATLLGSPTARASFSSFSAITPAPTPSATATPDSSAGGSGFYAYTPTPAPDFLCSLTQYGLREGDTVSAPGSNDPDIYIVNSFCYKRLFLNPAIFSFYGHLGGFSNVKKISAATRDILGTSGLFRNCETNDQRVYGVEITGEDTGILHWVNTTGAQAVADDAEFFKKVFCINNNEFNWYAHGTPYTSVHQIPAYNRPTTPSTPTVPAVKVLDTVPYLNVRNAPALTGTLIGQLTPGEVVTYTQVSNGWYHIRQNNGVLGWVSGQYVTIVR